MRASPFPDFFEIEKLFSTEQKLILSTIRNFVAAEVEPQIQKAWREEFFPKNIIPQLGKLGVFGAMLSGHGLPGMDAISYGIVLRELERCDSGLRSFASVQGGLVMYPIHEFGSEAQKAEWLVKLASGRAIGCFGLTESEGGSDPGAMKTSAVDRGDHWELNGSKMWITNGSIADVAVVWAKTPDGIRGFLVPTDVEGFRAVKMVGKISLRASVTSELIFDRVRLPKTARLPKADGLKAAFSCLNQARYGIAWGVLGAAECCFDEALAYAQERILFNRKLASFQLVQRKLAIMAIEIAKCQMLTYRLGTLKQEGALQHAQISAAKQANVEMALATARTARDILGANGIMDEYKSMRHLCNLETVYTYEGTNDIHLLIVGQALTGIPAFF